MAKIKELDVTQIRIFKADELPADAMKSINMINSINSRYQFQSINPPTSGIVSYLNGIFKYKDLNYTIGKLVIEQRRILFNISGASEVADAFYEEIIPMIIASDHFSDSKQYVPIIKTEETTTIVEMSFPFSRLIADPKLANFNEQLTNLFLTHDCRLKIAPSGLKFKISYSDVPEKYLANSIQIGDKELTIEQRVNTPEEDHIFYIKSPSPSTEHLKLVETLEKLFS